MSCRDVFGQALTHKEKHLCTSIWVTLFAAPLLYYLEELTTLIGHLTSNCWFIFTQYINELLSTCKVNLTNNYQDSDPRPLNKHLSSSLEHYFSNLYLWKRYPRFNCNRNLGTILIKFGTNKPSNISYNRKGIQYPPNRNFKPNLRQNIFFYGFLV